jgi:hypothetical protein
MGREDDPAVPPGRTVDLHVDQLAGYFVDHDLGIRAEAVVGVRSDRRRCPNP